jgi:hypothetical protein
MQPGVVTTNGEPIVRRPAQAALVLRRNFEQRWNGKPERQAAYV